MLASCAAVESARRSACAARLFGRGPVSIGLPLPGWDLAVVGADGRVDYNDLDRPAVERKRAQQQAASGGRQAVNTAEDLDFIDIPTFLRRQAD